ncbi:MAG: cytochrome c oxidase subunit II [Pirellulales bacterium]
MGKFWSVLFLMVPVLGVASFAVAPLYRHWLPLDVSEHGHTIDHLFYFILWLTGAVFVVTEVAMFWFMWRYGHDQAKSGKFTHGSHSLEIVWTIIPAATLLFIAIYQMNAWAEAKIINPGAGPDGILGTADDMPATLEVTGRQFEWRLRYPVPPRLRNEALGRPADSKGADDDTDKDLFVVNEMHIPVNEEILINLKSADVLHSFFLPNMRVKQDAVPGMKIPVWFRTMETGTFDIVCAELCGWGHYKMKGRLTIESRAAFDKWLVDKYREQSATHGLQPVPEGDSE